VEVSVEHGDIGPSQCTRFSWQPEFWSECWPSAGAHQPCNQRRNNISKNRKIKRWLRKL